MQAYVRLLNEGTEVFRPVSLERMDDERFRLLPTPSYSSDLEVWEVPPGEIVKTEPHATPGGQIIQLVSRSVTL